MSGLFSGGSKAKNKGDFKMTSQARNAENMLLSQLVAQANGTGPSVVNTQYEQAMENAMRNTSAVQASSRGVSNAGLLSRNVANANASMGAEMAQQSAINKFNEQQAAQGQLAQTLASQRGVALQAAQGNQNATMQQRQMDNNFIGNIGASAAMAFSDEDLKTNKKPTKASALKAVEEFLNSVEPYEYNYKGGDKVSRKGVMAQDLEDSELGRQMVKDTPEGKVVDYGQGFSAMMAGLAEMNKKITKLEKKG